MARVLKPCGTSAAYRRHLRKGEEACADCKDAVAWEKQSKLDGPRDERKVAVLAPVASLPEPEESFDPLEDAKENLAIVKAALREAVPREVSALSKRRQELVALIAELEGDQGVSLAEQLAAIRAAKTGTAN